MSHEWTDYAQVQDLYADGHEMASHTVTHSFGTNFNEETWANEVVGEAEELVRFGGVNPADIKAEMNTRNFGKPSFYDHFIRHLNGCLQKSNMDIIKQLVP